MEGFFREMLRRIPFPVIVSKALFITRELMKWCSSFYYSI